MRALSTTDAENILRQLYGISASANRLPGELDLNFHIRTDSGDQYLLKIYPAERQALGRSKTRCREEWSRAWRVSRQAR